MIKTRFAPSPTGYLHVGGLRTALFAYLFARKNDGVFVLRIEDTDQERYVEGSMENLIQTLKWVGLDYQEGPYLGKNCGKLKQRGENGPYIQSQRTEIYQEYAQKLLDSGAAYRCFCTKERLDQMREQQKAAKKAPMYDRHCLKLTESEIKEKLQAKEPFVIRQKMPYDIIKFKDLVRGNVQFDGKTIDDQILVKSDGFPTYHLANVVDDHMMEITHVIRGEEWLPSTPKHIALYLALGWKPPKFAHLPLLLNADKTKLSKRQGDVAVEDYINKGYLKEAIINFVTFLGWNPGGGEEKEIFTLQELEEIFSLQKVHKSGAIFNIEKLDWLNWQWQRSKYLEKLHQKGQEIDSDFSFEQPRKGQYHYTLSSPEKEQEFQEARANLLLSISGQHISDELKSETQKLQKALITVEEKILKTPKEVMENIDFYFALPEYDKELLTHEKMKVDLKQAEQSLKAALETLKELSEYSLKSLETALIDKVQQLGIKNGQLLWPIRAALSGKQFSPGVFEIAWALGKEETLKRIESALQKL